MAAAETVCFVLVRADGTVALRTLSPREVAFFDSCKQSPQVLVRSHDGVGWRVNLNVTRNAERYRLTFPAFHRVSAAAPSLLTEEVNWTAPPRASDVRVEVVHV